LKYYKKHKKEVDDLIAEEDILFEIAIKEKMKSKVSAVDFRKLVRAGVPRAKLKSPSEEEIKEIIEKTPKDWGVKTKSSEI